MRIELVLVVLLSSMAAPLSTLHAANEKCEPPGFGLTWSGYDDAELQATADPPQVFVITLNYLHPPELENPALIRLATPYPVPGLTPAQQTECDTLAAAAVAGGPVVSFCLRAPGTAPVKLDRAALLDDSGFLGIGFRALTGEVPTTCLERKAGPAVPKIKALDKHRLTLDAGSVFVEQGNGDWEPRVETAFEARSQWRETLLAGFNIRYSAVGGSAEGEGEGDGDEGDATDGEDSDGGEFAPFAEGGGVFEARVFSVLNLPSVPRFGLYLGAGFSSLPGADGSDLTTRPRILVGGRVSVQGYNAGRPGDALESSSGFIQVGVARDELWERVQLEPASEDGSRPAVFSDESDRWFVEGELELPAIGTERTRVLLRTYASLPRSGDGPSDVRVSALLTVKLKSANSLLGLGGH
jgi:hypothetical protein